MCHILGSGMIIGATSLHAINRRTRHPLVTGMVVRMWRAFSEYGNVDSSAIVVVPIVDALAYTVSPSITGTEISPSSLFSRFRMSTEGRRGCHRDCNGRQQQEDRCDPSGFDQVSHGVLL